MQGGPAVNVLARFRVEGDTGAAIAVEYPGFKDPVPDCAPAGAASLARGLEPMRTDPMVARPCAGQVCVNEWFAGAISTPCAGVPNSGLGRWRGLEAPCNDVRTGNIAMDLKG